MGNQGSPETGSVPVRIPRGAGLPFKAMLPEEAQARISAMQPIIGHAPKAPVGDMAFRRSRRKRSM